MVHVLLASASPARLRTLKSAGITPSVEVSHVDEDAVLAAARVDQPDISPGDMVLRLAQSKAEAVIATASELTRSADILIACDSMLEIAGEVVGKPGSPAQAVARWRAMRGSYGVLHTGHWIVDLRKFFSDTNPGTKPDLTDIALGRTASTVVHFASLSDDEIDAYVATGEPVNVAGAFTVDGRGGAFVTAIEGDFHNVVGISLPLVRELLGELGYSWVSCWDNN